MLLASALISIPIRLKRPDMPICHSRTSSALKKLSRRSVVAVGAALMAASMAPAAMAADNWPDKPLHLIVGFPAGSSPDLTARALAEPLEKKLGQTIIVENRV